MSVEFVEFVEYSIIVAQTQRGGIGIDGSLPWGKHLHQDLKHFRRITTENKDDINILVMGWKTWESLSCKPLDLTRFHIVLTRKHHQEHIQKMVTFAKSLRECQEMIQAAGNASESAGSRKKKRHVFVIGGESIYRLFLQKCPKACKRVYQTVIYHDFECDTFFPLDLLHHFFSAVKIGEMISKRDEKVLTSRNTSGESSDTSGEFLFQFLEYIPKKDSDLGSLVDPETHPETHPEIHPETQYLRLCHKILQEGHARLDRTGVGTLSLFGEQMRFDLSDGCLPLFTTRRLAWNKIVEELLWFLGGSTDTSILKRQGNHIWDLNTSRNFLDKCGFEDRKEGDPGPIYPFQWRYAGAPYVDCTTDYLAKGETKGETKQTAIVVDQVAQVLRLIKEEPTSRRILLCSWNVKDIPLMVLPPCHVLIQFYVDTERKTLSSCVYQRSADMTLGICFNVPSYALLTCLVAKMCHLQPKTVIFQLGDVHVYQTHIEKLKSQLHRQPYAWPILHISDKVCQYKDMREITKSDLELVNYKSHDPISYPMAV